MLNGCAGYLLNDGYIDFTISSEKIETVDLSKDWNAGKSTGKVFEDKVVTDNGQKLGNGKYDDKENVVQGVKVELLDVKNDENDKEMPSVLVNGEVSFTVSKGGKYFITKGTKRNTLEGKTKRNTTPRYVMPKTGVE